MTYLSDMELSIETFTISDDGKSITCKRCGMTSYHPKDVECHYCGKCNVFHDGILPLDRERWIVNRFMERNTDNDL